MVHEHCRLKNARLPLEKMLLFINTLRSTTNQVIEQKNDLNQKKQKEDLEFAQRCVKRFLCYGT